MHHSELTRNLVIILLLSSVLTIGLIPNASSQQITTQTQTHSLTITVSSSGYLLQCNSTVLRINIKNDQWNPIWKSAQIIDLVNVGGPYNGAGQTGDAFLGLECDPAWLYGFVAYMPPADENGHRSFSPDVLGLKFDTNDAKPLIPQKEDQAFDFAVSNNKEAIVHYTGAGVNNAYGGWNYKYQLFNDSTVADFHYSVTKTPFFNLAPSLDKNPLYQFAISREKVLQNTEFGLDVELHDWFLVSKANNLQYMATLPKYDNETSIVFAQPYLWPDVWMGPSQSKTQTNTLQSTTQSVHTSTSMSVTLRTEAMSGPNGIAVSVEAATALGIVAFAAALAVYGYIRRSRRKRE